MTSSSLSTHDREHGRAFTPKYDEAGLLSAVVLDAGTKEVLVVAFMNAEAVAATRNTGKVHFWSRSRSKLWMKGETSGHVLNVKEIRVDCDQDALVIYADPAGPACHTGAVSCFYRTLDPAADDSAALDVTD
ncbi:MAG: phosphoribosyl-AMP cyclohydrolase [Erythrobacter sp.]